MGAPYASGIGPHVATTRFSHLLEEVEAGAEITLTPQGTPIARVLPLKRTSTNAERRDAIER